MELCFPDFLPPPRNHRATSFSALAELENQALNDYYQWEYELFYWHTRKHEEIDLVLYGPQGFYAIEVKSSARIRPEDLESLKLFHDDYPEAKRLLIYGGTERKSLAGIDFIPAKEFFSDIATLLRF